MRRHVVRGIILGLVLAAVIVSAWWLAHSPRSRGRVLPPPPPTKPQPVPQPVLPPPPPPPVPLPADGCEDNPLQSGLEALRSGDAGLAELLFRRAAQCPGSYALTIARLFDPAVDWPVGTRLATPDARKALFYYQQALSNRSQRQDIVLRLQELEIWARQRHDPALPDVERLLHQAQNIY